MDSKLCLHPVQRRSESLLPASLLFLSYRSSHSLDGIYTENNNQAKVTEYLAKIGQLKSHCSHDRTNEDVLIFFRIPQAVTPSD